MDPILSHSGPRCYFLLDGWGGRGRVDGWIVRETPKRYEIEVGDFEGWIPGRRYVRPGDRVLVPKDIVRR